jgi:hypothetical protein
MKLQSYEKVTPPIGIIYFFSILKKQCIYVYRWRRAAAAEVAEEEEGGGGGGGLFRCNYE